MNLAIYFSIFALSLSRPLPTPTPIDLTSSTSLAGSFTLPLVRRNYTSNEQLSPADLHLNLQSQSDSVSRKYNLDNLSKRDSSPGFVALGDSQGDNNYFATVTIGTPPVNFELAVDTGSADLIVQAAPCIAGCTSETPLYRQTDSSSSSTTNAPFLINYQVGSASGTVVSDLVSFGGLSGQQQFGAVTTSQSSVGIGGVSGILGMAFQPLSSIQQTPFIQALYKAGKLTSPVFAFAFATQGLSAQGSVTPGGILNVGAVNPALFIGTIDYYPVNSPFYWQIELGSITVGGKVVQVSTQHVTIDTGTTNIYFPVDVTKRFYAQIPGSKAVGSGLYTYPCNSVVNAAFVFNKVTYAIPDENFNIGTYSVNTGLCFGAISAIGQSGGLDTYIIGSAFLKNYYVAFRFEPVSVGFAILANPGALKKGDIPTGNAMMFGQGANILSNKFPAAVTNVITVPPIPLPVIKAPLTEVVVVTVPVVAPVTSSSTSTSGSIGDFASALQNGITTLINAIAQNLHNTGLLITCRGTIRKTASLWTCELIA